MTPHKTWFDVLAECSFGLMGNAQAAEEETPSTVVRIGNVVTPEELTDDNAHKEVSANLGWQKTFSPHHASKSFLLPLKKVGI